MNENGKSMGDQGETGDTYELDELLGVYALDAVDADERRRVADYLIVNPRAAAEVQAHREVATMLAFTGMDAPAELWSRIAAEIESEAPAPGPVLAKVFGVDTPQDPTSTRRSPDAAAGEGPAGAPVVGSVAPPTPGFRSELDRRRRRPSVWVLGAAAAVVLAVAGAVVVIGSPGPDSQDPIAEAYDEALAAPGSVLAELVAEGSPASAVGVIDASGHGYLDAGALPRLSDEQTYQLWGVLSASGDVVSLGILGGDPEVESFTVNTVLTALAITIEQSPGVISDGNADGAFVGTVT